MRVTAPVMPLAASSSCQDQWKLSRRKSPALAMVMASVLPSRLLAVVLPIEAAGRATVAGSPPLARWRVIQPMLVPVPPPKPNSRLDCASKWLRTTGSGCSWPAPTTIARWPAW